MKIWRHLFFLFLVAAARAQVNQPVADPNNPNAPRNQPSQQQLDSAYSTGEASGTAMGTAAASGHDTNRATQNSNFNSLLQSNVNSMMNSQAGQASGQMLSSSLTFAAQPFSSSCDPNTISGNEACGTGSALAAMAGLMNSSSQSFSGPEQTAWFNTCVFSTMGCNVPTIPNPYTPIVNSFPLAPPPLLGQIIDTLKLKGYQVDPRTGLITLPNGSVVDMNSRKNWGEGLPGDSKEKMKQLLDRAQRDILKRLSKVNFNSYVKLLGLDQAGKKSSALAGEKKQFNDENGPLAVRYNRLPEKEREKTEITELSKSYGGTPIGIARANIFLMVKKRYGEKAAQKVFWLADFPPLSDRDR